MPGGLGARRGGQHVCLGGCGQGHGPRGVTGVTLTWSASDGGRGRFACDRSMGAGGPPCAGGPEEGMLYPGSLARMFRPEYEPSSLSTVF